MKLVTSKWFKSISALIFIATLTYCDSQTTADPYSKYEHALSSSDAFMFHPLIEDGTSWTIYYDVTEKGTQDYRDKFEGVIKIGKHSAKIQGAHSALYSGYTYKCGFQPLIASNTVIFQSELVDETFKPTDGESGRSHFSTFIFSGGLEGSTLYICSNTIVSLDGTFVNFGSANRSFVLER